MLKPVFFTIKFLWHVGLRSFNRGNGDDWTWSSFLETWPWLLDQHSLRQVDGMAIRDVSQGKRRPKSQQSRLPQTIAKLGFTWLKFHYGLLYANNYSIHGANLNQLTSIWGAQIGPHIAPSPPIISVTSLMNPDDNSLVPKKNQQPMAPLNRS